MSDIGEDHDSRRGGLGAIIGALLEKIPIIGPSLKIAFEVWPKTLFAIIFFAIIYPLILPAICASIINKGALGELQKPYAESIRSAFGVKEATDIAFRDDHIKLDYFYVVDFVSDGRKLKRFSLPVVPKQRVLFQITDVNITSKKDDSNCTIPSSLAKFGATLFIIRIDEDSSNEPLYKVVNTDKAKEIEINESDWKKIEQRVKSANQITVIITPSSELQDAACSGLEAEVSLAIKVFKNTSAP